MVFPSPEKWDCRKLTRCPAVTSLVGSSILC
jgi:hypothetical protein